MSMGETTPRTAADPSRRAPGDEVYARLHRTLLSVLTGLAIYGFVVARFIETPRAVGYRMAVAAILAMNVLWWSVADRRFARHIASARLSAALRLGVALFSLALNWPIAYTLVRGRFPSALNSAPLWYSAAVMMWHFGLMALMPLVAGLRLAGIGVMSLSRPRRAGGAARALPTDASPGSTGFDPSRRALLKTSFATVPIVALGGAVGLSRLQEGRLQVNYRELPAPWLPSRLRGLTITHISDLHLGRHYRPQHLPELVDRANDLNSDLVVITGDVVDMSNEFLPAALDAFARLTHRYGLFVCIGNHDEIDDRDEFIRLTQRRFPLLLNERRLLYIGGEHLTIGGLDWSRNDHSTRRRPGHEDLATQLMDGHDPKRDGPMIALAHHPHAWDALAPRGVPLVLSGHTHGGQLMLAPPDTRPDLGAGSVMFRYIRGIYARPGSTLFVNRGVGNWFPIRFNAPAEIVQLRLV